MTDREQTFQVSTARHFNLTAPTTTWDEPGPGLLLSISVEGDGYMVKDFVGLRYGFARTILQAVEAWANDVQWLITEPEEKLGDPVLSEARAYKKALPHG